MRTTKAQRHIAMALVLAMLQASAAWGLPTGGQVVVGQASFRPGAGRLDIQQTSTKAVTNWQSFSVDAGERIDILQPSSNAALLARVTGGDLSRIYGDIHADGRLYLINPNGVLIGPHGRIDTAGFTASTRDLKDADFLVGGGFGLSGSNTGGIVNLGVIRAREGNVLLLGHRVGNAGRIEAPQGVANLIAADAVFLAAPDAPEILVRAGTSEASAGNAIDNSGVIEAAQVRLAASSGNLYELAINQSGVIRATGVQQLDGRILLTAAGGAMVQNGTLSAIQADGRAGNIILDSGQAATGTRTASGTGHLRDDQGGNQQPGQQQQPDPTPPSDPTPVLTYKADDKSKLYGDANPALTYTVSGLQGGDTLGSVTTGSPVLSTAATLKSGVGTYVIYIDRGTLNSSSYTFNFVPGSLSVLPAPLTIDIANARRVYGAEDPIFSATSVSGLKAGDSAADILAGLSFAANASVNSGVGSYTIVADASRASPNYDYQVRGTLTIDPRPVTVSLGATSRLYGSANPDFLAAAGADGLAAFDTFVAAFPSARFATTAIQASPVGSYPVTGSGLGNPNYLVTLGSFAPLSVTKAPLAVNANDASRPYGDANPAFGVASITGFRNGDTAAVISNLSLSSVGPTANVGSYPIVPSGSAENYELVSGSGRLTITKAFVNVYINNASRVYGDADPEFSLRYEGLKNGETTIPGLDANTLGLASNAGAMSPISTPSVHYVILGSRNPALQNYLPTYYAGTLTITPRPLVVSANDVQKTYGENNPRFDVTLSGATTWDRIAYSLQQDAGDPKANAGTYPIAATNGFFTRFDNASNYAVNYRSGTLTINRAPVTILARPSIIWGDSLTPVTAYTVLGGLMPWDTADAAQGAVLGSVAGGTAFAPGNYPLRVVNGAAGQNYRVELDPGSMLTITRRPITITANAEFPLGAIPDYMPGSIEPFTVNRYDGFLHSAYMALVPLAGGPQFTVYAEVKPVTSSGILLQGTSVTAPRIVPTAPYSLDDILRYYDPVALPGRVTPVLTLEPTRTMTTVTLVTNPAFDPSKLTTPGGEIHVRPPTGAPGQAPSVEALMFDVIPFDAARLSTVLTDFTRTDAFKALSAEDRQRLTDALADPDGPGKLRQLAAAGDETALKLLMPVITAQLFKSIKDGTVAPDTEAALVQLINDQRAKTVAKVDAKLDAIYGTHDNSLLSVLSSPKIPDVVGAAYIDVAAEQRQKDVLIAGTVSAGLGAGVVAGVTIGIGAGLATTGAAGIAGTFLGGASLAEGAVLAGGAGFATVGGVAAVAVAIGVAEAVQVAESTKNYDRAMSFIANNGPVAHLSSLDLSNKDNLMQLMGAMSTLMAESVGGSKA
jgi:filamentous hemagglutinin family protein